MKKILFTLTALLVLFITSCQEDDLDRGNTESLENGFKLSYTVSDPATVFTKSSLASEPEENKIHSFYILFFEHTADGSGQFIEAIDGMGATGSLPGAGSMDITFPSGSRLNKKGEYKMLLCANINEYSKDNITGLESLVTLCQGHDEKTVNTLLLQISGVTNPAGEEQNDSNQMHSSNLPMSASVVKSADQTGISVELIRMVSRFDVFCRVDGYELESVSIWNAAITSPIWNEYVNEFTQSYTQRYYGVGATNGQMIASLYAFENSVDASTQNDQTTCLIVGLKNKEENGHTEYFRVDIKALTDNTQSLKRNNVYRTIVTGVKATGKMTEREAYISGGELLDTDINGWFTGQGGNVQIKDGNVLAVPTQHVQLYAHGDERTYYIYTLGEGNARLTQLHGNPGITVFFGKSEEQTTDILKRYELKITAEPGIIDESDPSSVTISFNGMSVNIYITQKESLGNYLKLSPAVQQYNFTRTAPQSSGDIIVNSSGKWKAKIYNGDYFSFNSASPVKEISGVAGGSFNVHTIETNPEPGRRYSFVEVYLEDMPSVSDAIILQQFGDSYLLIDPSSFQAIPAGGGSTPAITVTSSGAWMASVTVNRGTAYFEEAVDVEDPAADENSNAKDSDDDETGPVVWTGVNGDTFVLTMAGLTEIGGVTPRATVTLTLVDDESVNHTFTVEQKTLSAGSLIIQTRRDNRPGSVFNLSKSATYNYVYNLATNMRDPELFGPAGSFVMDKEFVFMKSKRVPVEVAHIFQVTGYPSSKVYKNTVTPWWKADKKRFLFFADYDVYVRHAIDHFQTSTSNSGVSGYTVNTGNLGVAATDIRYFNQDSSLITNKLLAYMLEDGPFTKGGNEISPEAIQLQSRNGTCRGLSKWPKTFIPLIMVNKGSTKYCVFGIDPTHRLIILTDPGIFGSRPTSTYPNRLNFDSEANERFMNNFIAWMTRAALEGESFYEQFQVGN